MFSIDGNLKPFFIPISTAVNLKLVDLLDKIKVTMKFFLIRTAGFE